MKNILFAGLLFVTPAASADLADGWKAYAEGDYVSALNTAKQSTDTKRFELACLAGVAQGGSVETGQKAVATLHETMSFCTDAFKVDQNNFEITAALSTVLSFEGKRKQAVKHANVARKLLFSLIAQFPQNAEAYGAYAAWHSEVHAAGFFARMALGAKKDIARDMFNKALDTGEVDTGLQLEYVKFLSRGNKADRKKALQYAKALVTAEQNVPLDLYFINIGKGLLEALEADNKKLLKKRLKKASLFIGIEQEKKLPTVKLDPWLVDYTDKLKK